jgi:hypothetical protein
VPPAIVQRYAAQTLRPHRARRSHEAARRAVTLQLANLVNHASVEQGCSYAGRAWFGPMPADDNPYERNNRWALYSALIYGIERVRLVALWDGKGGDGPGGTGHMVSEVRRLGGIAEHLDTTKFDYWQAQGKVGKVLDMLSVR